ncbi:MAG: hypothetical protein QXU81_10235 [Candidatus Bathyarchaeia archaeon]
MVDGKGLEPSTIGDISRKPSFSFHILSVLGILIRRDAHYLSELITCEASDKRAAFFTFGGLDSDAEVYNNGKEVKIE